LLAPTGRGNMFGGISIVKSDCAKSEARELSGRLHRRGGEHRA
jgi:hypothetical protein